MGAPALQFTRSVRAATIAAYSSAATTATKLPWRTTCTMPGIDCTAACEAASKPMNDALRPAGRTTRACSMPGSLNSDTKPVFAVKRPGRSTRRTDLPTIE